MLKRFSLGLFISFFSYILSSCGSPENSDSTTFAGKQLTGKEWQHINRAKTFVAVDKWFAYKNSKVSFFECLKKTGVDQYIATFNANLLGGTTPDFHLTNAEKAGLDLSVYYAWNNETGLSADNIEIFLETIKNFDIQHVFIDIETPAGKNTDDHVYELYQSVCVEAGYDCGVYTNHWGMSNAKYPLKPKTPLSTLPLWYADGSNSVIPVRYFKDPFRGWKQSHGRQTFLNDKLCGQMIDVSVFDKSIFGNIIEL
ncbi:MAG: hypothetical protein KBD78_00295 [Oligoflexales bacterium]|nr:hypothetical protein [Oligoflexales bacterium]